MKKIKLTYLFIFTIVTSHAQYGYRDGNRIGLTLGVNQTTLTTDNFKTKPGIGYCGGFSVRGNYYNNWSMIYGLQFFQSTFSMETTSPTLQKKETEFSMPGAQLRLLLSYNIIKNHISFDIGPVLQVNDILNANDADEQYTINGTNGLKVNQVLDINKINGNVYVGVAAGSKKVKAIVNYQYGFTNILNKLNKNDDLKPLNNNKEFKGNIGIISGQIIFNF